MEDPVTDRAEPAGADDIRPGDVLAGKYRVDRVIGAGGMGMVVQATHIALQDCVALKFLLPEFVENVSVSARFLREAQAAVRIKSPHVARVVDVGTLESGAPYMVMEFLEGHDLGREIEERGTIDVEQCALWTLQACEALAAAHVAGIVHRDIKPGNLFVTHGPDGAPLLKVLDFGISKVSGTSGVSSLTKTHAAMGSPMYMSPEQMRSARDVDARADIWSLGIVLYEALTGTVPFVADSMPQLVALVLESSAPSIRSVRPNLPESLDAVVAKCLQKNVADRYQTVAELAAAIAPFAGPTGIESATRSARILAGGSSPESRALASATRGTGATPAQPVTMPEAPVSTTTAFGRTDPKNAPPNRTAMYAALGGGLAVIALGAAWLLLQGLGSGSTHADLAQPEPIKSASVPSAAPPASASSNTAPEAALEAAPEAAPEVPPGEPSGDARQPPAPPTSTRTSKPPTGGKKPGTSVYDDRQ